MSILKKIQILLLAAIFAAGCTVIVYESPERRARSVYTQHWHSCPYGDFWGYVYWQCMWYYRYPYYSQILTGYSPKVRRVITKQQLKKPTGSTEKGVSTKVVEKKEVKKKSGKVIKKKENSRGVSKCAKPHIG